MSAINVQGIDHVGLWVSDLQRSVAWYRDVLGLEQSHGDERHVFFRAGNQVLALFQAPAGHGTGGPHHIALTLAAGEQERAVAELRARGIEVTADRGHFRDPDGHTFHFA